MKKTTLFTLFIVLSFQFLSAQNTFIDSRDGQEYRYVEIGTQTWMAENLKASVYTSGKLLVNGKGEGNVATSSDVPYFFFYDDDSSHVDSLGYMYTWFAAMNMQDSSSTIPSNRQGVCPDGWHLPSTAEWNEMINYLGTDPGTRLKKGGDTEFDVLLGGWRHYDGTFSGHPGFTRFWTTDFPTPGNDAEFIGFADYDPGVTISSTYKSHGNYVRCVKDYDKPYTVDSIKNISCRDCADGGIFITITGDPEDEYKWNTAKSTAEHRVLDQPGNYKLTVKTVNGYTFEEEFYIKQTDTIVDARDGTNYDIVKIGENWWMAENLNFDAGVNSWCYNDEPTACDSMGKLYLEGTLNSVCPQNWHASNYDDWENILMSLGMTFNETSGSNQYVDRIDIGTWLKKGGKTGFNALLAGYRTDGSVFSSINDSAYFWINSTMMQYKYLTQDPGIGSYFQISSDNRALSIRCVRNYIEYTLDNISPVSCMTCSDGEISITPSGGSGGLSVTWEGGTTGNTLSNISSPGFYTFTISDNENYTMRDSVYIKQIDSIIDTRNDHKYEIVNMNGQWWMAKNLNYDNDWDSSYCYDHDPAYCDTFGTLYRYWAIMEGAEPTPASPSNVQGVCPDGWMIPSQADWNKMDDYFGSHYQFYNYSGFNSKNGGYYYSGTFNNVGDYGYYWTCTEKDTRIYRHRINNMVKDYSDNPKGGYYSLRCIRNEVLAQLPDAKITSDGEPEFCYGDSITLVATPGIGYQYQWLLEGNEIAGATNSYFVVVDSGSYSVIITDGRFGGYSTSEDTLIIVHNTSYSADFDASPQTITSPPFDVAFDNLTPNRSNFTFNWLLGDNSTSTATHPNHTYEYNGNYDVTLKVKHNITGCEVIVSKEDFITCSGGSNCDLDRQVTVTGNTEFCLGDSVVLTAQESNADRYQWMVDDLSILDGTTQSITVKKGGKYNLVLENSTCITFSDAIPLTMYPPVKPRIESVNFINGCSIDSVELRTKSSYNSYQWSTGHNSSTIIADPNDLITVTVEDRFGCIQTSLEFQVNKSIVDPPNICVVTVDSATQKNLIVWEKPWTDGRIETYSILKLEGANYVEIGNLPFGDLTTFIDNASNPRAKAENYKITLIDTCGNESARSPFHQTMNLGKSDFGNEVSLFWNRYMDEDEIFIPEYYYIYRGTDSTSLIKYDSVSGYLTLGNPIYNILDPVDDEYYLVTVEKGNICDPAGLLKANSGPFSRSVSNLEDNRQRTTSPGESLSKLGKLQVYPNPMRQQCVIVIPEKGKYTLSILDMTGKKVIQQIINDEDKYILERNGLNAGMYIIELKGNKNYRTKLILK